MAGSLQRLPGQTRSPGDALSWWSALLRLMRVLSSVPPCTATYGFNISRGAGVFLNFTCVILDVVTVAMGDRTQIRLAVQIRTADHPRDPAGCASGLEFGRPIHIGRHVWIGGGAIILPGVTIADDARIGACFPP
jgi:maltose O-acetyltransferase